MLPKRFCVNGKNMILLERHISSECLTIIVSWLDEDWINWFFLFKCSLHLKYNKYFHLIERYVFYTITIIHAFPDRRGIPVLLINIC